MTDKSIRDLIKDAPLIERKESDGKKRSKRESNSRPINLKSYVLTLELPPWQNDIMSRNW